MEFWESSVRMGTAGLEGTFFSAKTYSLPSASCLRTSSVASRPNLRAKPAAAFVGLPSASNAMLAAGPRLTSWTSFVEVATSFTRTVRRRRVLMG